MLCALMYRQNGDLANLGGCNRYLGNAQIEVPLIGMGLIRHIISRDVQYTTGIPLKIDVVKRRKSPMLEQHR